MPGLSIKRLVRDHKCIKYDKNGPTFGEQVDAILGDAMANGEEIAELTFYFEGDEWLTLMQRIHEDHGQPVKGKMAR